jgi:Ser/Thr protein kinase RdoA (MazF antagonist)
MPETPTPELLSHWPALAGTTPRPFGTGLINGTFLAEGPLGKFVLQRLHRVFSGVVNEDIDALTRHLFAKRLLTPRLVPTGDGKLWVDDAEGRAWRVLTHVEGVSVDAIEWPGRAREAGRLVARFHAALADFQHEYRHVRAGVHDTPRHLAALEGALADHRAHRLYDRVAPAAEQLLAAARKLPDLSGHPRRHAHGDLKISNLLFDKDQNGLALVDLDTIGLMPWPHEMGDALRSWCNPAGEDSVENELDVGTFEAAVQGYAEAGRALTPRDDHERLVDGLETICLELSARFLADALNEAYFGWNSAKYAGRGEHNLVRGLGQASLGRSVARRRGELVRTVSEAFAG